MTTRILYCLLISIIIVLVAYISALFILCQPLCNDVFYCQKIDSFYDFYSKNIRGHLFAGFLALGGFLLSLKTFIIVNIKTSLYDNDDYKKQWELSKKTNEDLTRYGPLKELSDLLYFSILVCIISAVFQMTFGFITHWLASIVCVFTSITATVLLIESLRIIKNNLDTWFEYINEPK